MIKVLVLGEAHFPLARNRMAQVQAIFRQSFPDLADDAEALPARLQNPVEHGYRAILLVAESAQGRVDAFALLIHFPNIRCAFLDFIASKGEIRGGGMGGALYEGVRELCLEMEVKGLYIEVQPDQPELTPDPQVLKNAKRRIRFYEQYGVRIIDNPTYSKAVGEPPTTAFLLFDSLGKTPVLKRKDAKRAVENILTRRFRHGADPAYLQAVLKGFHDDPVHFLPQRSSKIQEEDVLVKPHRLSKLFAVVHSPKHELHPVRERGYFERPVRLNAINQVLNAIHLFTPIAPKDFSDKPLLAVHDADFVTYLRTICTKLKEKRPVYPDTFPLRRKVNRPKVLAVQAGYYGIDTGTPLYPNAYIAARATVDTVLTAAEALLSGKRGVYAACRPPGHHAGKRFHGGFCYFNNAAIAAHYLSTQARVATLDIDCHHGNGTQDIFYERADVLTVSIHGHPDYAYPYFSGYADEAGEGKGLGFNRNFPLPPHCDEKKYLAAFQNALKTLMDFRPEILVVSVGFDILKGDPTGTFPLPPSIFRSIGEGLMRMHSLSFSSKKAATTSATSNAAASHCLTACRRSILGEE